MSVDSVRCDHCKHECLLAFSCKGRWFCPSRHQKKVQLFGALLTETILFPVPHRHFTFAIPKMLRPYFRFDRDLLKDLCRIAHECLLDYLRTTLNLPHGLPGIVMAIHTFGEHLDFHPHLHALVADGLYVRSGLFYVLPDVSLKPLKELFRARVITFLVGKGLLPVERANMLWGWVHSGFNVHRSRRVLPDEREDLERLAQYIIRNPFSIEKMQMNPPNRASAESSIIYRSGMNPKIQGNFEVFTPCDFIAAITQHIPDKSFQLVRYYGWYSNKMRGQRDKRAAQEAKAAGQAVQILDVSEHKPRRIPSAKWRELIKKVWEADPLTCPRCAGEMKICCAHRRPRGDRTHSPPPGTLAAGRKGVPGPGPTRASGTGPRAVARRPLSGLRHRPGHVRERLSHRGRDALSFLGRKRAKVHPLVMTRGKFDVVPAVLPLP
jgi:hypothetical protein